MNPYISDSSGCSSGTQVIPRKRRRVDPSNASSLDDSVNDLVFSTEFETRNMKRQLEILRTKLSLSEATLSIRKQKEKLIDQEREILEKRVELDSGTIQQLVNDLGNTQSELSQVRISFEEELKDLKTENLLLKAKTVNSTSEGAQTSSQEKIEETQKKMEAAEQKIIDLEEQFDLQKIELDQAKVTINQLNEKIVVQEGNSSMETRVKQLEEELEAAKDIISVLRAEEEGRSALEEQIHCLQKRLDQQGSAPVQMDHDSRSEEDDQQESGDEDGEMSDIAQVTIKVDPELLLHQDPSSDSISNEEQYDSNSSSEADDGEDSSAKAPDDDEDESSEEEMETRAKSYKRISGTRDHSVCRISEKFFEIDWDQECERTAMNKWACMKCPKVLTARRGIVDHVWVQHYGEEFQCNHCTFRFKWRSYVSAHMKKRHPGLILTEKCHGK